jgi:hypothetical protein
MHDVKLGFGDKGVLKYVYSPSTGWVKGSWVLSSNTACFAPYRKLHLQTTELFSQFPDYFVHRAPKICDEHAIVLRDYLMTIPMFRDNIEIEEERSHVNYWIKTDVHHIAALNLLQGTRYLSYPQDFKQIRRFSELVCFGVDPDLSFILAHLIRWNDARYSYIPFCTNSGEHSMFSASVGIMKGDLQRLKSRKQKEFFGLSLSKEQRTKHKKSISNGSYNSSVMWLLSPVESIAQMQKKYRERYMVSQLFNTRGADVGYHVGEDNSPEFKKWITRSMQNEIYKIHYGGGILEVGKKKGTNTWDEGINRGMFFNEFLPLCKELEKRILK